MMKSEMTTDDWENRHDDNFITIDIETYKELEADSYFLQCLRDAGVDNWEGYDFACAMYNGEENECSTNISKQGDLFPEETE